LHGGGFRGRCRDDDGVFHRARLLEGAHHVLDRRSLLADRDVDTGHTLALLREDRIHGHGRFAGLAVADDQLALAAADRHHRVDGLEAGLQRLVHRLARDHAGRDLFDHVGELGVDRAFAVDRLPQRIDHAAHEFGAHGHFQNAARAFDGVAFGDVLVLTQNHRTDRVALEVQGQAVGGRAAGRGGEFQHFALHGVREAMHAHDAVGDGHHDALVANVGMRSQALDAAFDEFRYFCGIELHDSFLPWLSLIPPRFRR